MENERHLKVRILYNENFHIAQNNADDEQIPLNENNQIAQNNADDEQNNADEKQIPPN
jgi:hypothetical protein